MHVSATNSSKGMYAIVKDLTTGNSANYPVDLAWRIGTKYRLKIVVANSELSLYYNDALKFKVSGANIQRSNLYFKSGNYC